MAPYLFPPPTIYLPVKFEGVSYRRQIRTTPTGYPSYQLLAPEWQSIEHFVQGYYLAHALANMLTKGP
jgi:hypothetical protein